MSPPYRRVLGGSTFDLGANYDPQQYVGRGSQGVVCSATCVASKRQVAVKKIIVDLNDESNTKRTLREIRLLRHFSHAHVISLRDIMCTAAGDAPILDLYVITDLMATSLDRVIHSSQELSEHHSQYFTSQLLAGVQYLHSLNVLHRDLKPSNLLVNEDCLLRITDFGLARGIDSTQAQRLETLTEYVVTRWYRAPELVLCTESYSKAVDMWSVGCILAELLGRKPLFPGSNPLHQLNTIIDVVGSPTDEELTHVPSHAARYVRQQPRRAAQPLTRLYPAASEEARSLLGALLAWQPAARPTAEAALAHAFVLDGGAPMPRLKAAAPFEFEPIHDGEVPPRLALIRELCAMRPALASALQHCLDGTGRPAAGTAPPGAAKPHSWPAADPGIIHAAALLADGGAPAAAGGGGKSGGGDAEAAKRQAEATAQFMAARAAKSDGAAKRLATSQATSLAKQVSQFCARQLQPRTAVPGRAVLCASDQSRAARRARVEAWVQAC